MSDSKRGPTSGRTFTREEVEEILRRASDHANAATDDGILHEELLEAAREAGLDPASIDAAAADLEAQRADRQAVAEATAEITEERRRGFSSSLVTYLVVGLFLTGINLAVAPGPWLIWVLAIWGLFVALRGSRLLFAPDAGKVQRRVEKKRKRREADERKRRLKQEAQAWSERLRREMRSSASRADDAARASRDFEQAVDAGVQALLGVLARKVRDVAAAAEASERSRAQTDFDRYVDRQRRAQGSDVPPARVRVDVRPSPAKARVEPVDGEVVDDEIAAARKRQRRDAR
jgi:uncharacterized protein YhaN